MAFEYGGRFNTGDYFSTKIDIDNETAETTGTIDGIPVEFSGSSDFSIAEVTVVNSGVNQFVFNEAYGCFDANEYLEGFNAGIYNALMIPAGGTKTFKVPLYKGRTFFVGSISGYNISGNIENVDNVALMITGNCTITKP